MHAHTTHHHPPHRHVVSDVMLGFAVAGLAFAIVAIVMLESTASDDVLWHTLAIAIGIPSVLLTSFFCLRRGFEDSR